MKTTEVFVEQVLIGFMVILIGALPFLNAILPEMGNTSQKIGTAIGATGVAYLLGIPFDRFADTILSSLERRNRLIFSSKNPLPGSGDPYPEDLLKIAVQQANSGTVAWLEYLRSRMRLSRAIAVFAPGLTLSAMLATWAKSGQIGSLPSAPNWAAIATLVFICVIYVVAFFCALRADRALPRTEKLQKLIAAGKTIPDFGWKKDPVPRMLLPFIAVGVVLVMTSHQSALSALVGVAGLLTTLLTCWSWWRITKTYMNFLANYGRWDLLQHAKGTGS